MRSASDCDESLYMNAPGISAKIGSVPGGGAAGEGGGAVGEGDGAGAADGGDGGGVAGVGGASGGDGAGGGGDSGGSADGGGGGAGDGLASAVTGLTWGISSGRRSISVAAALNTVSQWPQHTSPLCALSCNAVT